MNLYAFIAAILFEVALSSFVIWGMIFRDKFDALIDAIEAHIIKSVRTVKTKITSVKVKIAKRWLRQAEIEIVSESEKKQIVLEFLYNGHMIVQPIPGGKKE